MKRFLTLALLMLMAPAAFAAVVEDWTGVQPGTNTGTYVDSNGSKIDFAAVDGPKASTKAIQLTVNLVQGGYAGIWHNLGADLSKSGSLKFMAKSSVPGDVQMALMDAYKVQYVAKFSVAADWAEVTVPLSSFQKDPYYTPADAVTGHAMDLSKVGGMNLQPTMVGAAVVQVGPIEGSGKAEASAKAAPSAAAKEPAAASSSVAPKGSIMILDSATLDSKSAGSFQDSQGSAIAYTTKDVAGKKGMKYLSISYTLVQGGYCGMWVRAGGADWAGVDLSAAKSLSLMIYSKDSVVLGLAIKDKANNQYVAETPATKGGAWETVTVPMSSFKLDPYYTPPDAVKGAPQDFSKVGTFNIQPKTVGKITVSIDSILAK